MKDSLKDILGMSVQEKIEAVGQIWDSIAENSLPVSDDELTIARERYQEYLKNPSDLISWEQAKKGLMQKYGF